MGAISDRVNLRLGGRRFDPPPPSPPGALEATVEGVENPKLPIGERVRQSLRLRSQGIDAPNPIELEKQTREQFLGAQVGQDVVPAGLDDFFARADLGLSDTFTEKKKKFLERFPEGDIVSVNEPPRLLGGNFEPGRGGSTILLRRNPNEPFIELDAPTFEAMGDIADLSGDVPAMILEAWATRGRSLVGQITRAVAGNVAGNTLKEAVEELRGFQLETLEEIAKRQSLEGLSVGVGTGLTTLVSGPINAIRGAAVVSLKPGTQAAQEAAKRQNLPALMPGQVAQSPLIQRLNAQAAALTTNVNQYLSNQRRAVVDALTRLRDKDLNRLLGGQNSELVKLHESALKQIVEAARLQTTSLTKGGQALAEGIAEYDNLSRALVNTAYNNARGIEEPVFDIAPLQSVASELRAGITAPRADGGEINVGTLEGSVTGVVDDILSLDPENLGDQPMEVLLALRQRLWDAKTPNPGEIARQPHKQAGKLYGAINHVIESTKNQNPEFVKAWKDAATVARERFSTMEKLIVIEASRTQTPAILARDLSRPFQVDNLKTLKSAITDRHWRVFQNAVASDFVSPNNLSQLSRRLSGLDKETRDLLFESGTFDVLEKMGRDIDALRALDLPGIVQRQDQAGAAIRELVETKNTAQITNLLRLTRFDPDHPARKAMRAGIIDNIWGDVVSNVRGELIVDGKKLSSILKKYKDTGVSRLLTKSDLNILNDIESYASVLSSSADAGVSLIAASTTQSLLHLNRSAFLSLLHNISIGRLATSKFGQRALTGRGVEALPFGSLRLSGAILGDLVNDLRETDNGR